MVVFIAFLQIVSSGHLNEISVNGLEVVEKLVGEGELLGDDLVEGSEEDGLGGMSGLGGEAIESGARFVQDGLCQLEDGAISLGGAVDAVAGGEGNKLAMGVFIEGGKECLDGFSGLAVIEDSFPDGRKGENSFAGSSVGGTHLDVFLHANVGKECGEVKLKITNVGGMALVAVFDEISKGVAGHVDVALAAANEEHGDMEDVFGVVLVAPVGAIHEGGSAAAVGVGTGPDVIAIRLKARVFSGFDGAVGKEGSDDGAGQKSGVNQGGGVLFGDVVVIGLDGAGDLHHPMGEVASGGEIVAHNLVAGLWHPGDVIGAHAGVHAPGGKEEVRIGDRFELVDMAIEFGSRLEDGSTEGAAKFELAAWFKGDGAGRSDESDDVSVIGGRGFPVEMFDQLLKEVAETAGFLKGEHLPGALAEHKFLGFRANEAVMR